MSDENGTRDTEQIRAEIGHTRDELAETVEALTAKTDVKGRAAQKAHEVQETAKARAASLQETAKVRAVAARTTATQQAKAVSTQARIKGEQARLAASEKAHTAQETVQQQRQDKPWLLPAVGATLGLVTSLFVWLRRRNR